MDFFFFVIFFFSFFKVIYLVFLQSQHSSESNRQRGYCRRLRIRAACCVGGGHGCMCVHVESTAVGHVRRIRYITLVIKSAGTNRAAGRTVRGPLRCIPLSSHGGQTPRLGYSHTISTLRLVLRCLALLLT